ncbi:acyl carrier protein [Streptomyces sp. NPDC002825]|uniref:acyl carrier protein n=1 Tax=Streptomyces sp. NPDC002825 TaxID=3154666 RepID=UPI00332C8857
MSNTVDSGEIAEQSVRAALTDFLEVRTRNVWEPTTDLFETGAVSSLFAMELVVHVEQTFGVTVEGEDLNMENFRTVEAMVAMVTRLKAAANNG